MSSLDSLMSALTAITHHRKTDTSLWTKLQQIELNKMGTQQRLISASVWRSKKKAAEEGFFAHTHGLLPILVVVCGFCKLTPTQGEEG